MSYEQDIYNLEPDDGSRRGFRAAAATEGAKADTEIAALKARILELTEWRPMETAPRDGTKILLFRTLDRLVIVGFWHDGHDEWIDGEYIAPIAYPDFWLPISELPSLPGSEGV